MVMDIDVDIADTVVPRNVKSIIFEVEMYGDTICPWCYLGKKSVDRAIETYASKHPEDVFDIIWKPFILWPTAKVSAYDKRSPIVRMVGPTRAPGVFGRLATAGAEYGVQFNWEGLVGNSADANKLIMLALKMDRKLRAPQEPEEQRTASDSASPPPPPPPPSYQTPPPKQRVPTTTAKPASPSASTSSSHPSPILSHSSLKISSLSLPVLNTTQHAFLEALFHHTFTQGFDPSDRSFLISLSLSMDPPLASSASELVAYLDSDEADIKIGLEPSPTSPRTSQIGYRHKPAAAGGGGGGGGGGGEETKANSYSERFNTPKVMVNGVPSVVVQGRYRVGGMQKPEVYLAVFEKVREDFLKAAGGEEGAETGWEVTREEEKEIIDGGGGCYS